MKLTIKDSSQINTDEFLTGSLSFLKNTLTNEFRLDTLNEYFYKRNSEQSQIAVNRFCELAKLELIHKKLKVVN